jgi:peptidase E
MPEALERLALRELVDNWVLWRDAGDWDRFRTVWHDDGRMMATWMQGTAAEFIQASREGWDRGVRILHFLGGMSIDLALNLAPPRAIGQTKMTISQRATVHEVLCDVVCTGRFYDFFEKRDGRWGLVLRQPIYEKDRIDPVDPGATLRLDPELLKRFPEGYRHLAYVQALPVRPLRRCTRAAASGWRAGRSRHMRLLLVSNSTLHGSGYLDHCAGAIASFLEPSGGRVLFVPYALFNAGGYADTARRRFEQMGIELDSVHDTARGPVRAVEQADALFIGGGNTFRLLTALWREKLVEPIRDRMRTGMSYVGTSAGSNVACPTIKTTNDMPIVEPPTFAALDLVPFQINPHYQDPIPGSTHMGETREQRIAEFLEENAEHAPPVVGLREGAWLLVENRTVSLQGSTGARMFRRGEAPMEYASGARLDFLII